MMAKINPYVFPGLHPIDRKIIGTLDDETIELVNQTMIETAKAFGISVTELKSKKRSQPIPTAKRVYINLLHLNLSIHQNTIARTLDMDRTSILHHIKNHWNDMRFYPLYQKGYNKALKEIFMDHETT